MNPQETQQVIARDEKWVPSMERVKISPTNALTISAEVPEIFMQQFWYTIKKVKDIKSYELLLANKKCIVNAEVFRKILDICPRVEGPLHKYTSMENIDYPELIWEDFVFQIDHKMENKSRRETMPFPRFTKVIINHFLSQHKSLSKLKFQHYHTIKDDGIESIDVSDESEPEPAKKKTGSRSIRGVVIQDTPKQEDADIMQALKESKKTSRRQPSTGGSSEGTGRIPGVPDESTIVSATSSEGTGTKPGVPDEEKVISEENVIPEWGSKHESEHSEDSQLNSDEEEKKDNDSDADDEDEEDDHVSDSQDTDDEDVEIESDEDEIYKYKIQVHKDVDVEMKESETVECENKEKVEMTDATKADLRVAKLEKDVSELKKIDHSVEVLALLKSQVLTVLEYYLGSKLGDALQKIQKPSIDLEQESETSASEIRKTMHENKSFNRNPANHALYHALMEALIEDENAMDKGVADTVKDHKRQHEDDEDDDEDPPAGQNQGTCTSSIELAYNMKECFKELTDRLYWNNPKGDRCPFDLTKPFPLKGRPGHLTVAAEYFFNNDLEFLKSFDLEKKYTTSITKIKAARYEIVGIEYMTPTLWSTIKHGYDKDAEKGIKHWGERRKLWYKSQVNKFSKHNVYSTQKILGVKSVSVKKLHGYGHLEEIVVKRVDRQLYKFKEGDFVDLHMNDIEDMLLLAVQHKLFHFNGSDIFDFIVALRMFTRSLIIKRCVKDLQLGVERVIYEDLNKLKRVMLADELYKFSDGTLKTVRDELHRRTLDFLLGYNKEMSRRKWTDTNKRRPELMVELIDKQMRERRIIRNLERLVGTRELEMDYKLMTRTV
ncbi:retrovirus-related pol polyprotein from transposon TNT 1-94 [Tanacetum coccineum]